MNRLFPIRAIGPGICLLGRDRFVTVVEATPINFGLRSPREQEQLVLAYQGFLNGLEFPVTVLVRADPLRVDEYLAELKSRENEIEAHLRPSFRDYLEFIRETAQVRQLMRRRFFLLSSWQGWDSRSRPLTRGEPLWEEAEQELHRREDVLAQGLRVLGIRIRRLSAEDTFRFVYASLGPGRELPSGVQWEWEARSDTFD